MSKVGTGVGTDVGILGSEVGILVGTEVGILVGSEVGILVGSEVGKNNHKKKKIKKFSIFKSIFFFKSELFLKHKAILVIFICYTV